jgi:hypothetical protein
MGAAVDFRRAFAPGRLALAAVLALAACSALDKRALTGFTPAGTTGFTYTSQYGQLFLLDDPRAEAQRLDWLAQYVAEHHLCPNGYKIVSRTADPTNYTMGVLTYRGVCT